MIEEIKDHFKDFTPLIHSYLTIGFQQDSVKSFIDRHENLNPVILSQFPPNEQIPDSVIQSCFPWGVELLSESNQSLISSSFQYNFILTNDDGSYLYCSCAKVYMPVLENTYHVQRLKTRRMSIKSTDPLDLPSFDTHFPTARSNRSTMSFGLSTENSPRDFGSLFVPKCIVLLSRAGFIDSMLNMLKELIKLSSAPMLLPLECYIAHMIMKIPLPPKGKFKVMYQLGPKIFNFSYPAKNKLPLLDVNVGRLFSLLNLENVLIVFRQLVTEQSIVFLSSNENNLTTCSYTLLALLFPLKWSLLYAPILPEKMVDNLYSPVPFVFGMHFKYRDSVYARCNGSVLIVDLDHNKIEMNLQAVKISQQTRASIGVNLPPLPIHYGQKLKKRLKNILSKVPLAPNFQIINEKLDDVSNEKIRECFFQFFVSILQGYSKYLEQNWNEESISNIFDRARFCAEGREKNCKFIQKLIKTQMFANFCQTRVKPRNKEDKNEKLFFDDHIQDKLNRSKFRYNKQPTKFIHEDSGPTQEIFVEKIYKCYNSKGQMVYSVYPDLDLNVLKAFGLPAGKSVNLVKNSVKVVIPTKMPEIKCKTDEDFIYTTWIHLWAATLWYQKDVEHTQRLRELTKVMEMINYSKNISPALLYKHLLEICMEISPALSLAIFSTMSQSPIIIGTEIIKLLRKIISKLFTKSSACGTDQSWLFTHSDGISPVLPSKFPKRIFVECKHSSKQEVSFLLQDKCENCLKELSANDIIKGWKNAEHSIKCECGAEITPNLRIKIQIEAMGQIKFLIENVKFLNPKTTKAVIDELLAEGENWSKLDVEGLRKANNLVFWNIVWHFYKSGLPYEFLMPYENEVMQSSYININHFENDIQTTDDKESQTEWNANEIEEIMNKYFEELEVEQ